MTTTFDSLTDDVLLTLDGFGLSPPRASALSSTVLATDMLLSVPDVTGFEQGIAEINEEIVFISAVDRNASTLTVARGQYGTTALGYPAGTTITMAPVWSRKRIKTAINEAILGVYPSLWGVGSTAIPFNPAVNTYPLPAVAEKIVAVFTETIGPSHELLSINRYSTNLNAPATDFSTGKCITVEKGGFPGRNLVVVYRTPTLELVNGSDAFTASGLRETAKTAIKYAACSYLTAYMDAARLPVDSAQAEAYNPTADPIGNATKISAQLYSRFQIELVQEQRRLFQTTPATISVRTR